MKRFLTMLPLLLLVGHAGAVERHDTKSMTCAQIKSLLQSEGKATLETRSSRVPGLMKYGTYVGGRQHCKMQNTAQRARITASDGTCVVVQCSQYGRSQSKY